jgi:plasmid stability protein
MATLTLKQIPTELVERLREEALRHRRSLNQQAIFLLEKAVATARLSFMENLEVFYGEAGAPPKGSAATFAGVRSKELGREVDL